MIFLLCAYSRPLFLIPLSARPPTFRSSSLSSPSYSPLFLTLNSYPSTQLALPTLFHSLSPSLSIFSRVGHLSFLPPTRLTFILSPPSPAVLMMTFHKAFVVSLCHSLIIHHEPHSSPCPIVFRLRTRARICIRHTHTRMHCHPYIYPYIRNRINTCTHPITRTCARAHRHWRTRGHT